MVETSIIIRAFNEEKRLPDLFDAIDRQGYRDFETIVVDSGSIDRTRDIASERADRLIRISSHDFTFGYSLNVGIKAAKGRFLAIASAHTVPCHENWLERLIAPLRDDKTAMSYGRQIGMACSKFSECQDFTRTFGREARIEDENNFRVNNANSAIRRDLWERYSFDEQLTGLEDIDWAKHWMEEGFRVVYEPEAVLYHIHEESWRQVRRRYYREAVAARRIKVKGGRTTVAEVAREVLYTLNDLAKAFIPGDNPVAERLTLGQRLREVIYFRSNKNCGTIKAMLASHPMETLESRERALFDRSCEAVVVHGPGKASLEEIELPELKPGEALIRVAHVAVCATDLEIFKGTLGYYKNGMASYPIVPGHEFSGRVVSIGQNVNGLGEGDPVIVECIQSCGTCEECASGNFIGCAERAELGVLGRNGAYAGYVTAPARFVHKLPKNLDLRAAALCEPLAVVIKGMRRLQPALRANGSKPLRSAVIGAGPLGHLCALVLAERGHQVTAFDRNPDRLRHFGDGPVRTSQDLSELTAFQVVVEATGDPHALNDALHNSPPNASLLLLGLPYGQREFSFETIAAYDKTVIGSVGSTGEDFEDAIKLLSKLKLDAFFKCSMPLKEFQRAWEESRKGNVLKVILNA